MTKEAEMRETIKDELSLLKEELSELVALIGIKQHTEKFSAGEKENE